MNNKAWLLICLFCWILVINAEEIPLSLPPSQGINDNIATKSPSSVCIIVQGINNSGGYSTAGMFPNNLSFSSYKDYMSFVVSNSSKLFNLLTTSHQCTNINLNVYMSYMDLDSSGKMTLHEGLGTNINVSSLDDIQTLNPAPTSLVVIPMTNVSSVTVQFADGQSQNLQLAGSIGFILDTSNINNWERSRIQIVFSDGSVGTYTQFGSLITPPILSMLCIPYPPVYAGNYNADLYGSWMSWYYKYYGGRTICYPYYGYWNFTNQFYFNYFQYDYYWLVGYKPPTYQPINFIVQYSSGSDVLIQSSFDLVNWTNVTTIPWDTYIGVALFPVDGQYISGNFFRAIAY